MSDDSDSMSDNLYCELYYAITVHNTWAEERASLLLVCCP